MHIYMMTKNFKGGKKMKKSKIRKATCFRVEENIWHELQQIAGKKGFTAAEMLRQLIYAFVQEEKATRRERVA